MLIGVSFSLMFTTFDEVKHALQPQLGALGAIAAAMVPMLCVGGAAWFLLLRLLGPDLQTRDGATSAP
jgi:hypothetical protein